MRSLVIRCAAVAVWILLPVAIACSPPPSPQTGAAPTVSHVIDGDTIVVNLDGHEATVRLVGLDTPETVHPERPVECFGPEASAFTSSLLPPGTAVSLERDREERDAFGRLLLYVHRSDGLFVNHELVARGFATVLVIPPNDAYAPSLREAESAARTAGAGLWGACEGSAGPAP